MKHFSFYSLLFPFTSLLNFACNPISLVVNKDQKTSLKKSLDFRGLDLPQSAAGCAWVLWMYQGDRVTVAALPAPSQPGRVWGFPGVQDGEILLCPNPQRAWWGESGDAFFMAGELCGVLCVRPCRELGSCTFGVSCALCHCFLQEVEYQSPAVKNTADVGVCGSLWVGRGTGLLWDGSSTQK